MPDEGPAFYAGIHVGRLQPGDRGVCWPQTGTQTDDPGGGRAEHTIVIGQKTGTVHVTGTGDTVSVFNGATCDATPARKISARCRRHC